jgi:hypothetical protein
MLAFGKHILATKFILLAISKVISLTFIRLSKDIFWTTSIISWLFVPNIHAIRVPFFPRPFLLVI